MRKAINAVLILALRDLLKLLRDRPRLFISLIFPFLFIGALGGSLQANLGESVPYDFIVFVFTGVFAQNLFQSTAQGIISLIEDRENDFSREIFVSPISRYMIIFGKIVGETLVSLTVGVGIFLIGILMGVPLGFDKILILLGAGIVCSVLGGAFGTIVMANLSNQRTANQIFPVLIFPQFFLAGVFNPIQELPFVLDILSRISPMRYAVDFVRGLYYIGNPEYEQVVLASPLFNAIVIGVLFTVFLLLGTWMFVRNEKNA